MSKLTITASAPVLLVRDVQLAAAYYKDKLGFHDQEFFGDPVNFAMVRRDGFTIMLGAAEDREPIVPNWKRARGLWDVYIWVADVDAIYAEYRASGAIIDYTLGDKAYGVREFGVQDLDGYDIAVGQIMR